MLLFWKEIRNSASSFSRKLATLLLLALLLPSVATASPLILAEAHNYPLAGHLAMLLDKSGQLDLKDILTPANRSGFKHVPGFINQGYTSDAVWVTFSLLRNKPFSDEVYLHFWPPYLDFADVYVQKSDDPTNPDSYEIIRLGDHVPVAERPIRHPDFIAPFVLPEGSPRNVYIRLKSSSSLSFFATIHNNANMISHGNLNIVLHSGYLAIALVISVINIIFFIRLRDRLYLYFALYVLALFINHVALSGTLNLVWPNMAHLLSDYFVGVGVGFLLIFFSLFGMQLFNTRTSTWLHRFFILTITLGCSTFFSVPLGWYNRTAPFLIIWSILIVFILTWLSSRRAFCGGVGGKLYLSAFGASNIGYLVQFLRVLGLIPVSWWNIHAMQIGTTLNMVLMTLALTERLHSAEQKALQLSRESEQKAVSLAEEMTRDLREKQAELEAALQNEKIAMVRKERFISMINHEYRTPLAIIQTNISILELKIGNLNSLLAPIFTKIRRAMDRLVEVLETSLEREKQADSTNTTCHQAIFIGPFINKLLLEVESLWPERHLQTDIANMQGQTIAADSILLRTACLNIISNAFDYSPPEQTVWLTVRTVDNELIITVTDHGCGIPADQLDQVFTKNYRGSTNEEITGHGVGLYLVKSVIDQFCGNVTLESSVGSGTTATVTLPLLKTEKADG